MSEMEEIDYSGYDREQLIRFLKMRDRQANASSKYWVRAAKKAFVGDMRELQNRVAMIEEPFVGIVQSS